MHLPLTDAIEMTNHNHNATAQLRELREKVERHFEEFGKLLSLAEKFLRRGEYESSAAYAQVAAYYAWFHPTGLFACPELEEILKQIGMTLLTGRPESARIPHSTPKQILHVLTEVHGLGGHTRFAWRWIQADADRTHCVALTGHGSAGVPELLRKAVEKSGGQVHYLDRKPGGLLCRARALRRLSRNADQVVLHIHPYDVVPLLAFPDRKQRPPLTLLNHGDHVFWIGGSTADQVAQIRDSGRRLSAERRGIPESRSSFLPIPLEEKPRTLERAEAKRRLGVPEDSVVLLTIATPYKFSAPAGEHFTDVVAPIIQRHTNVRWLVIGPTESAEWARAASQTNGRVKAFGRRADTDTFYQAADVYLDSFPFSSLTSCLEAGSYGNPIVSYRAHSAEAEVLCGDDLALSRLMKRPRNAEEFQEQVSELVEAGDFRNELGKLTKESIREYHMVGGWNRFLEELYAGCGAVFAEESVDSCKADRLVNELDLQLTRIYEISRLSHDLPYIFRNTVGVFPLEMRFEIWKGVFGFAWRTFPSCVLADWQKVRLRLLWAGLKALASGTRPPSMARKPEDKSAPGRLNETVAVPSSAMQQSR